MAERSRTGNPSDLLVAALATNPFPDNFQVEVGAQTLEAIPAKTKTEILKYCYHGFTVGLWAGSKVLPRDLRKGHVVQIVTIFLSAR